MKYMIDCGASVVDVMRVHVMPSRFDPLLEYTYYNKNRTDVGFNNFVCGTTTLGRAAQTCERMEGKNVRFYDFSIKSVVKASKGTKNKGLLLLL